MNYKTLFIFIFCVSISHSVLADSFCPAKVDCSQYTYNPKDNYCKIERNGGIQNLTRSGGTLKLGWYSFSKIGYDEVQQSILCTYTLRNDASFHISYYSYPDKYKPTDKSKWNCTHRYCECSASNPQNCPVVSVPQ